MHTVHRVAVNLDPTTPPEVRIHPDGICTDLTGWTPLDLSVEHWHQGHTPEALVAWLRAAADEVEAQWQARRLAEQHPELTSEVTA